MGVHVFDLATGVSLCVVAWPDRVECGSVASGYECVDS